MLIASENGQKFFPPHFLSCIQNNANEEAISLLQNVEQINKLADSSNLTLLHYAAKFQNKEMTRYFIEAGCDVNAQDIEGNIPVLLLMKNTNNIYLHGSIVKLLMENSDIFITDKKGVSSIKYVIVRWFERNYSMTSVRRCNKGYQSVFDLCIDKINADFADDEQKTMTSLLNADDIVKLMIVTHCNVEICRNILNSGYPINFQHRKSGCSALHFAIMSSKVENAKILLFEFAADAGIRDNQGHSPLYYYCTTDIESKDRHSILLLRLLRSPRTPAISMMSRDGMTELGYLMTHKSKKTILNVLESGIDIRNDFTETESLIHLLIQNVAIDAADIIDNKKSLKFSTINSHNHVGLTPLILAARSLSVEKVKFLLEYGADPNVLGEHNFRALKTVTTPDYSIDPIKENERIKIIELLLEYGAEITDDVVYNMGTGEIKNPAKVVIAHTAMLQTINALKDKTWEQIKSNANIKVHFDSYKKQIEEMKNIVIHESVTLFKLLTVNEDKLLAYSRNQEVISAFNGVMDKMYHDLDFHFVSILRKRIAKSVEKLEEMQKAASAFRLLTGLNHVYIIIIEKIMSYLDLKDIKNLGRLERILLIEK